MDNQEFESNVEESTTVSSDEQEQINSSSVDEEVDYNPLGKTLKNDFIFLLVIYVIIFALMLFDKLEIVTFLIRVAQVSGLSLGLYLASRQKLGAGIVGIVFGILLMITILEHDILDAFLGLLLFIHSLKYIKNYKAQSQR